MKKTLNLFVIVLISMSFVAGCKSNKNGMNNQSGSDTLVIADYTVASDSILRTIPVEYIDKARTTLHVAYQHTSHGTHVTRGLFGLPDFKPGDSVLFGITNNAPEEGKLDFRDFALVKYGEEGRISTDLSNDETAFIQATRNYLDDTLNADINVVMWSWCNIGGHKVAVNYLPGMDSLIAEYGVDGSKIKDGTRQVPVTFVYMTGHGNTNSNIGEGNPKDQADIIIANCKANGQFCLDYHGIDTHDMMGNYWADAGDDGQSASYGGNFYVDWQNAHQLGVDYYENKLAPGGEVVFGEHNTQHITANRKAYAMWWILARIAGWDGK